MSCAMTRDELQDAISCTLEEIEMVKKEIAQANDTRDKRRLIRRKRELQYLQLWHLDQLKNLECNK